MIVETWEGKLAYSNGIVDDVELRVEIDETGIRIYLAIGDIHYPGILFHGTYEKLVNINESAELTRIDYQKASCL